MSRACIVMATKTCYCLVILYFLLHVSTSANGDFDEPDVICDAEDGTDVGPRSFTVEGERFWPGGVVPYSLDPRFSRMQIEMINEAMNVLNVESNGCVTWVPHTDEPHHVQINFLTDNPGKCNSWVGRNPSEAQQNLNLGEDCFRIDIVIHEMMHSLGFIHEHQRVDRDCYVQVLKQDNDFTKQNDFGVWQYPTSIEFPYDYQSIMHYSKRGLRKYIIAPDNAGGKVLSPLDVWKLRHLYCGDPPFCQVNPQECQVRMAALQKCIVPINHSQ